MCPIKSLDQMTAEELYKLAAQREQKEQEAAVAARQTQVDGLKEQRKRLIADHKKALATLDRELKALSGRHGTTARTNRGESASKRIIELLQQKSPLSTTQLKAQLLKEEIDAANLGQQLAYLKRKGRISSPGRGLYAITR